MISRIRLCTLASAALLLAACAAPLPRNSIAGQQPAKSVAVLLAQQEIEVDKPDVYGGGGLLGVLIESAVESTMDKNRQKAVAPLRDATLDFDFEEHFLAALRAGLPAELVQRDAPITVYRNLDEYKAALRAATPAHALGLEVRYAWDPAFRALYVVARAFFGALPPEGTKREAATGLQQDATYVSEHVNPAAFGDKPVVDYEVNAPWWGTSQGAPTEDALRMGIDEVVALVSSDLLSVTPDGSREVKFLAALPPVGARKATVARDEGSRLLVKTSYGALHWIDAACLIQ